MTHDPNNCVCVLAMKQMKILMIRLSCWYGHMEICYQVRILLESVFFLW